MAYSSLHQQVLTKLNPVNPHKDSQRNVSSARSRARPGPPPGPGRLAHKSSSLSEGVATSRQSSGTTCGGEDLGHLLIPAIMRVQKEWASRPAMAVKGSEKPSSSVLCALAAPATRADVTWRLTKPAGQSEESRSEQDLSESGGNSSLNSRPSNSESLQIQTGHSVYHDDDELLQSSCSDHDDSSHSNDTDVKFNQLSNSSSNEGCCLGRYKKYDDRVTVYLKCSNSEECKQYFGSKDKQSRSNSSSSICVDSSPSRTGMHARSSGYNSSSLQTSEIPPSPDDTSRRLDDNTSDTPTSGQGVARNVRLLELAEREVQSLLEEVLAVEARQEAKRRDIGDEAGRTEAERSDALANEEYVRAVLGGRALRSGTLEAAYLYQLWEAVKAERMANRRGITYDMWLREKRERFREEKERLEREQQEREEAHKARREGSRVAFEKWCEVAMRRPKPPPFMTLATGKNSMTYVRPGTFFNPKPWVDVLEEERKENALREAALKSEETVNAPRRCQSLPSTRSGDDTASWGSRLQPPIAVEWAFPRLRGGVTHWVRRGSGRQPPIAIRWAFSRVGGGAGRGSTYDRLADWYADLLGRCCTKERRRLRARAQTRGGVPEPEARTPASGARTFTVDDGRVRVEHQHSKPRLPLCDDFEEPAAPLSWSSSRH